MIAAVLFDLDGTLVDHQRAASIALRKALGSGGRVDSIGLASLERQWFALERKHMDTFLVGDCSFAEQRRRRLREFLPELGITPGADGELDAWFIGYVGTYEANWTTYRDVHPRLNDLVALGLHPKLGVLTNGEHHQQCSKIARCGLLGYFDEVLVSQDLGYAKPAIACFAEACRRLEVAPEDTVYIGDALDIDARAAAAAGLCGVWLDRHDRDPEIYRPRIESLAEVPTIISQLAVGRRSSELSSSRPPKIPSRP